ncbi:hypothetical protein [Streptomyces sp. 891-h]|uniref:hypothetical protein n=1 Tax=Streptomyces sp. 891-h TaxID=2720714 RepID=UPI001FA96981|nr:hypothetical protein [Streptomyces sp. 891-h]UNZ18869.1 hypothetical protein HC362_19295 [Streptomyces sp. 891-h]
MSDEQYGQEHDEQPNTADWDAFWAEERVEPEFDGMPFHMFEKEWHLPSRLPALIQVQMHRVRESADPEDIENLLGALLPRDLVDELIRRRADDRRMAILLAWAVANTATPGSLSLERARQLYDERDSTPGKARKPRPSGSKNKKRKSSGRR